MGLNMVLNESQKKQWEALEAFRAQSMLEEEAKRQADKIDFFLQKLPPRYREKSFDDYTVSVTEQVLVKQAVMRYAETFLERKTMGTSMIFQGNVGNGKTLLALILYQYLAQHGHLVAYEPSLSFLRTLQEKNFESQSAFEKQIQHYNQYELLIIDEATEGCVKGGCLVDWEKHVLFTLINARYQEMLPTLVITNCKKLALTQRLGEPIIDRLNENGVTLAFTWDSYRKK